MEKLSSPSHQFKYDVFLSFSGRDTHRSVVGDLYAALVQDGLRTFKDDDDKEESKAESTAIEESSCTIVIFSKSYCSSAWCLDQLVKIMKSNKEIGHLVLPLYFDDIQPSDLQRPESAFGELFAQYDMEKARAWGEALVGAANLDKFIIMKDRHESRWIWEIVHTLSRMLHFNTSSFHQKMKEMEHKNVGDITSNQEKLIGIEHRMQEVKSLLEVETVKVESKSVSASPSPQSSGWTYDVYMSFVGDDCREFADQLHHALHQRRINTSFDDLALDELPSGEFSKCIEESPIAVVIFSKHYAASSRCLDELEKIMKYNEGTGQIVLPVFYYVDSSDVRNQTGSFGDTFLQHKPEKVEIWRNSLVDAGSLAGWYLNDTDKSHEATTIENIVDTISRRLVRLPSYVDNNLIGMENRVKHVLSSLENESGGVRILGICGMGGVGKTAIARAVFDKVSKLFEFSYFLENIREVSMMGGLRKLQKEVLSELSMDDELHVNSVVEGWKLVGERLRYRKSFIVLDHVDGTIQLHAFAGSFKLFGQGSRIIITTRDKSVLPAHTPIQIYCPDVLNSDESFQFLRSHAFNKKDVRTKEYEELLLQVVRYADGLPLALKVLSSLLCGKSTDEWRSTLARLKKAPEKNIQDVLKISFNGFYEREEEVFLLLACFFNGEKKDRVVRILNSCRFYPYSVIGRFEDQFLIRILEKCIHMHPLLQQMGRYIARQLDPDEPGKCMHLWHAEDVYDVLVEKAGTGNIIAIFVNNEDLEDAIDMTEAFKGMENLRLLQVTSGDKLRFPKEFIYLPDGLRWLAWENYPLRSLPASFKANNLVGLELVGSSISELWTGIKDITTLRFLDLSWSNNVIRTPDFTGTPNLMEVKLEDCSHLTNVHESIGSLRWLNLLSLRNCGALKRLPLSIMKLESLRSLDLDMCGYPKLPRQMGSKFPSGLEVDVGLVREWWSKKTSIG